MTTKEFAPGEAIPAAEEARVLRETRTLLAQAQADPKIAYILLAVYDDLTISTIGKISSLKQLMVVSTLLHDLAEAGHSSAEFPAMLVDALISKAMGTEMKFAPDPSKKEMN